MTQRIRRSMIAAIAAVFSVLFAASSVGVAVVTAARYYP